MAAEEPAPEIAMRGSESSGAAAERAGWRRWRRACCTQTCPGAAPVALWRACCAEVCGTALLLVLGCVSACAAPAGATSEPAARALGAGLTVALIVQCLDHVSGAQLNPTVTLAAVLARRVAPACGAALAAAQLVGAAAGACALALLAGDTRAAVTRPAAHVSDRQALALEALLGAALALANLSAWDARNAGLRDSWPLRIGAVVAALTMAAGELTGASMNPARSLAPALYNGDGRSLWVYVLGPLGGSALATALYAAAWRLPAPPAPAPPHAPAHRKPPLSP